eukprot:TRINITY_DN1211_c0_g2_i1.p1 TRINITY_DN1211_c0_g2~~TRINITY_DN1211_c0_g2_i1.p1  ORF type:complete len:502 (+),score=120.68 TRINITY_DN1211_c0_g2_i1:83-1588(+)
MAGRFRNQAALLFRRSVFFQETPPQQHRSLRSRSYLYWSTLSIPGVQNRSEENSATALIGNCAELQLGGYKRGPKNISTTTHQTTAVILSGVQSARVQNTINSGYVTRHHWMRSFASGSGDVVEAVVPFMGESVSDGTLATFLKKPGDSVEVDEAIAQIETDKVTVDVTSPEAGIIEKFVAKEGDTVVPGTKVAVITKAAEGSKPIASAKETPLTPPSQPSPSQQHQVAKESEPSPTAESADKGTADKTSESALPSPKTSPSEPQLPPKERERRIPMTRLRKRVATRLKDSQNTFAMLTTFNEIDMTNLMQLRSEYKDSFQEKHGVKLGFMSGFIKGAVCALQDQPIVNAVIDGDDIIYRDYIDISIAVGTPKGLVVPVIRNADKLNFAEVEKTINALAKKANTGTISIDEMAGGTFTISNGGVYGSLLSTPIINPPQSAILGMHSIQNRPMVVKGNIVARPMMYVALTYDHRLIDGREAVYFLRRIKDVVEDPRKLLLDL